MTILSVLYLCSICVHIYHTYTSALFNLAAESTYIHLYVIGIHILAYG